MNGLWMLKWELKAEVDNQARKQVNSWPKILNLLKKQGLIAIRLENADPYPKKTRFCVIILGKLTPTQKKQKEQKSTENV